MQIKEGLRISPEKASRVLGISPGEIRKRLRDGTLPVGHARKAGTYRRLTGTGRYETAVRYSYDIYVPKVLEYVGLKEWPEGSRE